MRALDAGRGRREERDGQAGRPPRGAVEPDRAQRGPAAGDPGRRSVARARVRGRAALRDDGPGHRLRRSSRRPPGTGGPPTASSSAAATTSRRSTRRSSPRAGITRCKLQMLRTMPQPEGGNSGRALCSGLTLLHYGPSSIARASGALRQRFERGAAVTLDTASTSCSRRRRWASSPSATATSTGAPTIRSGAKRSTGDPGLPANLRRRPEPRDLGALARGLPLPGGRVRARGRSGAGRDGGKRAGRRGHDALVRPRRGEPARSRRGAGGLGGRKPGASVDRRTALPMRGHEPCLRSPAEGA